jgi:hypothetical protein
MKKQASHPAGSNEKSMYAILVGRIPDLKAHLNSMDEKSCPFKVAAFFAAYTKKQIQCGNYMELKKCLHVADDLLRLSATDSKPAIQDVYLFALMRHLNADLKSRSLLPPHMKRLYLEQLKASAGVSILDKSAI